MTDARCALNVDPACGQFVIAQQSIENAACRPARQVKRECGAAHLRDDARHIYSAAARIKAFVARTHFVDRAHDIGLAGAVDGGIERQCEDWLHGGSCNRQQALGFRL